MTWGDIPLGADKFVGELTLEISEDFMKIKKIHDSTNVFGGNIF